MRKADIDWKRGQIHVQRTLSLKRRIEAPKNGRGRWGKASSRLLEALRDHIEAMNLDAEVGEWTPEQRQWVFPTPTGRLPWYTEFLQSVWRPALAKAGLAYRRYHATRHSDTTWMLDAGANIRHVSQQLGHAHVAITLKTYSHLVPDQHEHVVEALDQVLVPDPFSR